MKVADLLRFPLNYSCLQKAITVAAMAENTAIKAECVRVAAVEEREAAVNEVNVIRETMEVTSSKLQQSLKLRALCRVTHFFLQRT